MDKITLEKIGTILNEEAIKENLQLISYRYYRNDTGNVLEVLIDKDFQISLDEINKYTSIISPLLDNIEELNEPYMLDVSSGGSEREIKKEDLNLLINHYLDILLNSGEKILAELLSYDDEEIEVIYFIKGRKKKNKIKFENIKNIHMGYKK